MRPAFLALLAGLGLGACVTPETSTIPPAPPGYTDFSDPGLAATVENWLGVSAMDAASIVERAGAEAGRPNAFIYGEEAGAAIAAGLRYGSGTLITRSGLQREVYWQGPSIGWDFGGNASKTLILVYDLDGAAELFQRFPGVEGAAYLIGGAGMTYHAIEGATVVPVRTGVGARLGANVGYIKFTPEPDANPF